MERRAMKFDLFDEKMRKFEQSLDTVVPADFYMAARLDGKGFTRLTKQTLDLKRPFDERFRDAIIKTVGHLMEKSAFEIVYAYAESDEISLLFKKDTTSFNRKVRKYNSLLAAQTSVKFSQLMGAEAIFDCRMIPLPTLDDVQDYFLWRMEDSHRNSIHAYCYYQLRDNGKSAKEAADELKSKVIDYKTDLLAEYGIDINAIPSWEMYGYGVYFTASEKVGFNPVKNTTETAERRVLHADFELPHGDDYRNLIKKLAG